MKDANKNAMKYRLLLVFVLISSIFITAYLFKLTLEEKIRIEMFEEFKQKEKQCIATALYHEARGEGELGMKAVANVIHNRYNHPKYPSTYCGVINQHKQFSYTLEKKPIGNDLKASLIISDANKKAYDKAEEIADDLVQDNFKGFLPSNALHYATTRVKNYWTRSKHVVMQIGNHKFYAEKEKK